MGSKRKTGWKLDVPDGVYMQQVVATVKNPDGVATNKGPLIKKPDGTSYNAKVYFHGYAYQGEESVWGTWEWFNDAGQVTLMMGNTMAWNAAGGGDASGEAEAGYYDSRGRKHILARDEFFVDDPNK